MLDALAPLGKGVVGGQGAIYYWARLPSGCQDDQRVVEWLVKRHKARFKCSPGHARTRGANLLHRW